MKKEQYEHLESGVWRAVEARRKGRTEEQEQQRQAEKGQNTGQEQSKQGKQVRFGQEDQLKETRAESTDKLEVTGRTTQVRTGRGSAGLVRGGDERRQADETSRKGKRASTGAKEELEAKEDSRSRTQ